MAKTWQQKRFAIAVNTQSYQTNCNCAKSCSESPQPSCPEAEQSHSEAKSFHSRSSLILCLSSAGRHLTQAVFPQGGLGGSLWHLKRLRPLLGPFLSFMPSICMQKYPCPYAAIPYGGCSNSHSDCRSQLHAPGYTGLIYDLSA